MGGVFSVFSCFVFVVFVIASAVVITVVTSDDDGNDHNDDDPDVTFFNSISYFCNSLEQARMINNHVLRHSTLRDTHLVICTLSFWYFIDIFVNITLKRTTKIATFA